MRALPELIAELRGVRVWDGHEWKEDELDQEAADALASLSVSVGVTDLAKWEDPRVQLVYKILCDDVRPPDDDEHWEGFVARRIVAALSLPSSGVTDEQVEAACKAHAPQWGGIDAEIKVYARQQMRAALEAALSLPSSGGEVVDAAIERVLVPIQPTLQQAMAGEAEYQRKGLGRWSDFIAIYCAMVAASPFRARATESGK